MVPESSMSILNYRKQIKSCYRWVEKTEFETYWMNSKIHWNKIGDNGFLNRGRNNSSRIIFCWQNSFGGIRGGLNEEYGSYLVRIDLVDNVTTFDRNTQLNYDINGKVIEPTWDEKRRGVDNELVYANYKSGTASWFQEYMIKEEDVIYGWTVNDQDLKDQLRHEVEEFASDYSYFFEEMHFFWWTSAYAGYDPSWPQSGKPFYSNELKKNLSNMEAVWRDRPETFYQVNPMRRSERGQIYSN
jgi:hypothetical protein